jgi:5-(carboxyamino)imidazole ribonucleotide synthase
MGYKVVTLDPVPNSPCGQIADKQIVAEFDDFDAAFKLAEMCDVITYEFENVNVEIVEALEEENRLYPRSHVLRITQNRLQEKEFVRNIGIGVVDFCRVECSEDVESGYRKVGLPAILKTVHGGYDGKGQVVVESEEDLKRLNIKGQTLIWEKKVPFIKELSVVCARDVRGNVVTYPVSENIHRENILDMSIIPARISKEIENRAKEVAETIAVKLDIVGVFCVEMFLLKDGRIFVNEIAPRPHNSGHYTINACVTSQFEQQLRAVCGLPLGSTKLLSPAAMVNILGEGRGNSLTGVDELLQDPDISFHFYGKKEAMARRKMGHITVLADSVEEAIKKAEQKRKQLKWV